MIKLWNECEERNCLESGRKWGFCYLDIFKKTVSELTDKHDINIEKGL